MMKKLYLLISILFFSTIYSQNPADIDLSYDYNDHDLILNGNVTKSIILSNGKVLIVGDFTGYRTVGSSVVSSTVVIKTGSIIRLNTDLSYDDTFDIGKKLVGPVYSVAVQTTGKILVAGSFTSYNGTTMDRSLLRFNTDGSLDNSFKSTEGKYSSIKQVKVGTDNKIYTATYTTIKRLTENGDPDSFSRTYGSTASFQVDSNRNVIIGGFDDFQGKPQVFKINSTDYPASGFDPGFNYYNCGISSVDIQSDGKILVGGSFGSYGSQYTSYIPVNRLLRLNIDGSLDTSFVCPELVGEYLGYCENPKVTAVLEQPDGKILVGGIFPPYNGAPSRNLIRLNSNGTIDNTFVTGTGTNAGINSISLRANGNILVCASNDLNGVFINDLFYNSYDIKTFFELDNKGKIVNREKSSTIDGRKILIRPDGKFNIIGESRSPYHRGLKTINNNGTLSLNSNLFGGFDNKPKGWSGQMQASSCLDGAVQPDGKIILVGDFDKYNDILADGIIRLNNDYSIDTTFNLGQSFTYKNGDSSIQSVAIQTDGKILVGGYFDTYRGTPVSDRIIRLNPNGELDTTFNYNFGGGGATQIEVQTDGKILINAFGLLRLNSDGTRDTTFNPQPYPGYSARFALLPNGKILIPHDNKIKRINSDGTTDSSFNTGEFDNAVSNSFAIQSDGKIICAGRFNSFNNISTRGLVRLNSDGTLDTGFNIGTGFNAKVESVVIEPDGKILVAGSFTNYNGAWCNGSVRLLGGDAFVVNGQNKIDYNNNGCDINDVVFPNLKFKIVSNSINSELISNNTGNYSVPLPSGKHTITPQLENPAYYTIQPTNITVDFPSQVSPLISNFCISPNGAHPDLEISLIPINAAIPGFISKYKILYKNKGNQIQSGSINLTFDDSLSDVISTVPTTSSTSANNLKWNFTNLSPLESREIELSIRINKPTDTPPANAGTVLKYTAEITSLLTDDTPKDNTFNFNHSVVNSFDPNDKSCIEGATIQSSKVGEYVHYVIHFENSGTYIAQNITVRDVIDTNKFDIASLIPQTGSHLFTTKISEANKVEFLFEGINLPFDDANNDGYVAFKIKIKSSLKPGDEFSNSSSIYFDYNSAITTNTATTKIESNLENQEFSFSNNIILYPNPVNDILFIGKKDDQEIKSLNIYNMLGQILLSYPIAEDISQIDVSKLSSGSYFIKIKSDHGDSSITFIKK